MEEGNAQPAFQRLDLMAYGSLRDVQRVRGAREALMTCSRFEYHQRVERRKPYHRITPSEDEATIVADIAPLANLRRA